MEKQVSMDASTLPQPKHIRGYHGEVGRSMSGRNVRDCIWTACLQALDRKACPIAIKPVLTGHIHSRRPSRRSRTCVAPPTSGKIVIRVFVQ